MCRSRLKIKSLKGKTIILFIGVIIFLFPAGFYFFNFRNFSISNNTSDWALFGDFIGGVYGGIYSVIVTILVVYLARELSKRDNKRNKQIKAIEIIYQQIKTIENNNYNHRSITKLRKDINSNDLYLTDMVKDMLIKLADQFQEFRDQNGSIDYKLRDNVMIYLKNFYEQ